MFFDLFTVLYFKVFLFFILMGVWTNGFGGDGDVWVIYRDPGVGYLDIKKHLRNYILRRSWLFVGNCFHLGHILWEIQYVDLEILTSLGWPYCVMRVPNGQKWSIFYVLDDRTIFGLNRWLDLFEYHTHTSNLSKILGCIFLLALGIHIGLATSYS